MRRERKRLKKKMGVKVRRERKRYEEEGKNGKVAEEI